MAEAVQRLYLEKGVIQSFNIYVDTVGLTQHQYDGIRFLYRQFKKGKAGVILNDPPGFGKRVQTVLFLNAIRPIMTVPTLILCTEGIEEVWTQQFHKWTNMGSDVLVQKGNEYTKSMCVIGTISQVNMLCRREWGVAIIDDNNVSREILRAGMNAKYKIWLTSSDMKKYLHKFSSIYKWLYPKNKFIVEDFQADTKPTALLANSVKLDAFLEDIVIRRRDAVTLEKTCSNPERLKVTRKNKDVTGKKIKRSKPLPDEDHNTSAESQETGSEQNISAELATNRENNKRENIDDFFVNIVSERANKLDKADINDELADVTSNRNQVTNNYSTSKFKDNDGVQEKTDKMKLNPAGDEVPGGVLTPESDTGDESFSLLNSEIHSQNFIMKFDSETQDNEMENDIPAKKSKITNEINVSEDLFSTNTTLCDSKSDKVNSRDTNANKNSDNLFSTELPAN